MTVRLDHTIVAARDKVASARFFAEIFGLTVKPGRGHFAQVQVNETLTFDFADEPDPRGTHYAFHVSEPEFEVIFDRVKARGLAYGSGPFSHTDRPHQHPSGRARLLLRGPQRPPARSHDGAGDGKLTGIGYSRVMPSVLLRPRVPARVTMTARVPGRRAIQRRAVSSAHRAAPRAPPR